MKNTTRWILLTAFAAGMLFAAPYARAAMAAEKDKPTDKDAVTEGGLKIADYQELMNRNLFSKNQRPPRPDFGRFRPRDEDRMTMNERLQQSSVAQEFAAVGKGEADIVLTGVVDKDGAIMAFLEDRRPSKPAIAVKSGDVLAGGKVGKINLGVGMMEYIAGDKTVEVVFGFNLLGKAPSETSSTPSAPATTSGASGRPAPGDTTAKSSVDAGGSPPLPGGAAESILEKMRKKRQQEGGR